MDFIYFLGRFHVLALHLPIGILLLAAVLEVLARFPRFAQIEGALPMIWFAGAVSAVLTIALGYMHAAEGGFEGPVLEWHRWTATATAAFAFAVWAWRSESPATYRYGWPLAAGGVAVLLTLTGHFGGALTHGSTYLTAYAPAPLQRLMGHAVETRPEPTRVGEADIYLDVVAPALERRCAGCHNDAKTRGDFSVASYEALMRGGESGAAIAPGDPAGSDMIRRINLLPEDIDAMPKDGKTPLSPDEIALVEYWVSAGAPAEGSLDALSPPAEMLARAGAVLGLPAESPSELASAGGASRP